MKARGIGGVLIACLALSISDAAAQGGGGGGGIGGGKGRQRAGDGPGCGAELIVVLPDGQKREYVPLATFLEAFKAEAVSIDQGEDARQAVPVDVVLKAHGADWMEALDCNNRSLHLPSRMPFEGREYLVVTGKRGLKAIREVRPKAYANTLAEIRKLTLHKVSKPQPAPAGK